MGIPWAAGCFGTGQFACMFKGGPSPFGMAPGCDPQQAPPLALGTYMRGAL